MIIDRAGSGRGFDKLQSDWHVNFFNTVS
jgi:hypothetical protein